MSTENPSGFDRRRLEQASAWPRLLTRLLLLLLLWPASATAASTLVLVNLDGPGEGLNDPAPWASTGGNPAGNLGDARRNAVELALALWAEQLDSPVPVQVGVEFSSLGGDAESAPLALGGATSLYRDFAGAPRGATWYPSALADRLAGLDLGGAGSLDIAVEINADVDGSALGSARFYYGFDQAPPAGDVNFVEVILHELAHGLGFQTYADGDTGAELLGYDDAFLANLEHHGAAPGELTAMTDAGRSAAFTAGEDLHWTGAAGLAEASGLTAGTGAGGHPKMYAPTPYSAGSSVVHFSTDLVPDSLMEPFYLGASGGEDGLAMTRAALADLGWNAAAACTLLEPPGAGALIDDGDAGTSEIAGDWTDAGGGYDGDARVATTLDAEALYSFSGLSPGMKSVSAYLPGSSNAHPVARYTVSAGGTDLLRVVRDQTQTAGFSALGQIDLAGSDLQVRLDPGDGIALPVANPSFEAEPLADSVWKAGNTVSWTNSLGGIQNPSDTQYPGATDGDSTPSPIPHGLHASYGNGSNIQNILSLQLTADHHYYLSAWVGRRVGSPFAGYAVQLLGNAAILAEETSLQPAEGEFLFTSLDYHAQSGDPYLGRTLRVNLHTPARQTYFDAVRLRAVRPLHADAMEVSAEGSAPSIAAVIAPGDSGYQEAAGTWSDDTVGSGGSSRRSTDPDAEVLYSFSGLTPGPKTVQVYFPVAGTAAGPVTHVVEADGIPLAAVTSTPSSGGGWVDLGTVQVPGSTLTVRMQPGSPRPVAVTNPSFEADVLADGAYQNGDTVGWTYFGSDVHAIFNLLDGAFPGATDGDATPSTIPDGLNILLADGGYYSQVLPEPLTPDTRYTLQVEIGQRLNRPFVGYSIELWAGGILLAEDASASPAPGAFESSTLSFYAPPDDLLLGNPLEIRLTSEGRQTIYDDVRLDANLPVWADAVRLVEP